MTIVNASPSSAGRRLETEAPIVLRELRRSVASLLSTLPKVRRAVDLAEQLHLDRSLAWKIWRVGAGADEFPSPKHIPGRGGVDAFLAAAAKASVPTETINAVRLAFDHFAQMATDHAGDRASVDIMLGGFTNEGRARLEMALRRDGFRANSHFLGVQARVLYQADIVSPAPRGMMPEITRLRGHFGLRRMRPDTSWVLSRSTLVRSSGPSLAYRRTPLDPAAAPDAMSATPLVSEFSSSPRPAVRRVSDGHSLEDVLDPGPIGEAGAVDIVVAELASHIPAEPVSEDAVIMQVATPSERVCYDVFLHRDVYTGRAPDLDVITTVHGGLSYTRKDKRDRVPIPESLQDLGPADTSPFAAEVPRHAALSRWLFDKRRADPAEYRCFRIRIKYAPIPISIAAIYQLSR